MSASEPPPAWDLTPVFNLLHSFKAESRGNFLTASQSETVFDPSPLPAGKRDGLEHDGNACRKLGDFGAVWAYLSQAAPSEQAGKNGTGYEPRAVNAGTPHPTSDVHQVAFEATVESRTKTETPQAKKILLKRPESHSPVTGSLHKPTISLLARPKAPDAATTPDPVKESRLPSSDAAVPLRVIKKPLKSKFQVESTITGSKEEKKQALIQLLRTCRPKEDTFLANASLPDPSFTSFNVDGGGIHVFVDMSNIMVGFHDCIKTARKIPLTQRVPRLPLSFHNFSLVLERGRPVSKRVLVGSDRFAAIDEAEKLGYETNILVRVQKVKDSPHKKKKVTNGIGSRQQEQSSGSETNSGSALEKWVEQAVDEILHLKMLESIVDTDKPSTIVLVTGDAAEAEYSGGFLKMVERALQKGWSVELVSFCSTTSRAYTRKEFRSKWGSRFKLIELDRYAEYLLDM